MMQTGVENASPAYVDRSFRCLLTATTSEIGGDTARGFAENMRPYGVQDCIGINGLNPGSVGVWLAALLASPRRLSRTEAVRYARMARHLAAASRLRASRASAREPPSPEAVLDPKGRLVHAEGDAKPATAREALRAAVVAFDKARGPLRRRAPDDAVLSWRVLVQSRWSLLDQFESDGRRFVVAQVNPLTTTSPTALTPRERQVLTYLGLGYSTKVIAYELGISDTTVRVLLSHAASKLGLGSRSELCAWAERFRASE